VGLGYSSILFEARQIGSSQTVVIKSLKADVNMFEDFIHELIILSSCNHKNVCNVIDIVLDGILETNSSTCDWCGPFCLSNLFGNPVRIFVLGNSHIRPERCGARSTAQLTQMHALPMQQLLTLRTDAISSFSLFAFPIYTAMCFASSCAHHRTFTSYAGLS